MVQSPTKSGSQDDLPGCPIPLTHRRLRQAHLLWHQTLDCYHDAERFRANLNATLEAIRSVTWMLQKEKHTFTDFDAWYGSWQQLLKDDPAAKWLKDARTEVVHKGDLESYSYAEVRLVSYRNELVSTVEIPIETSPQLILSNPSLLEALASAQKTPIDLSDASFEIERRWSTKELDGREILSALASVY